MVVAVYVFLLALANEKQEQINKQSKIDNKAIEIEKMISQSKSVEYAKQILIEMSEDEYNSLVNGTLSKNYIDNSTHNNNFLKLLKSKSNLREKYLKEEKLKQERERLAAEEAERKEREKRLSFRAVDRIFSSTGKTTDLQKKEQWPNYQGQEVTWTCRVGDVKERLFGGYALLLKCNPSTFDFDTNVIFKEEWKKELLNLKEGDKITVSGKLDSYSHAWIYILYTY